MDLLEKKSLLNFSSAIILKIHKVLVFLKNHLNLYHLQIFDIFECFLKKYNRLLFFFNIFFRNIMIENLHPEEEKIIEDIRNLFGLEKELDNTAILFRQKKKESKAIKDRVLRDMKNLFK